MPDEWEPRVVRDSEGLSELAYRAGSTVKDVLAYSKNAELQQSRTNPDVLCPGDVVWLPAPPKRTWLPVTVGSTNTFKADVPKLTLNVKLRNADGTPMSGAAYEVTSGGGNSAGTTDGDGTVQITVCAGTRHATVRLPDLQIVLPVRVGALDPADTASGAVGRLSNLGYYESDASSADPGAEAAYLQLVVEAFQRDAGLDVTGDLDDATKQKLAELGGKDTS